MIWIPMLSLSIFMLSLIPSDGIYFAPAEFLSDCHDEDKAQFDADMLAIESMIANLKAA